MSIKFNLKIRPEFNYPKPAPTLLSVYPTFDLWCTLFHIRILGTRLPIIRAILLALLPVSVSARPKEIPNGLGCASFG